MLDIDISPRTNLTLFIVPLALEDLGNVKLKNVLRSKQNERKRKKHRLERLQGINYGILCVAPLVVQRKPIKVYPV